MHNKFTLLSRVVPSGKMVVYYYAYNEDGKRLGPWTTKLSSKIAARNYCLKLAREGALIPLQKDIGTFAELAEGFWEWETSPYLEDRRKRNLLTKAYADKNKRVTAYSLLPYFGKMRLEKITLDAVEEWFDYMIAKGYKHTTINGIFGTLRTMLQAISTLR